MLTLRHAPAQIALVVYAALLVAAWPFTVDDAFIALRYAVRIAVGQGYTFSGTNASDGVTGPLWLLPLGVGAAIGWRTIACAKALSLLASLVAACSLVHAAGRKQRGALAASWTATVCATSLPLVVWSVAGLETGLAAAIASWLSLAVFGTHGVQAGLACALLAWLRPELAFFAAVLVGWLGLRDRRAFVQALMLALVGVVALLAFRWLMFGHWLPMSASAKPASLHHGARYLGTALAEPRVLVLCALGGLAWWRGGAQVRVLLVAVLAHALAVLLAGGDWMPSRRLFVPVLPVLAFALGMGMRRVHLSMPRVAMLAGFVLIAASAWELARELPAIREAGATREREAPRLAALACGHGSIAAIDVGILGVLCPDTPILDLAGLTDATVAYARGGHLDKQLDARWLRRATTLVLHSREAPRVDALQRLRWFAGYPVERRALGFDFVRAFRVRGVIDYAPGYHYVVLEAPAR